jgi:4-diphosphocytidyl-2-C-methyl-D-erythritol kinase
MINGENMNSVYEKAYGKINLYLDVVDKRDDGYHNILSAMHTVGLYDGVTVSARESGIVMTCSDPKLSCGEDNLCVKAAKEFFLSVGADLGCEISLEKTLPMGAGMGGGSADAAAVLRGLNRLYKKGLSNEELRAIAVKIGADVPFCIVGGCKKAEGIGEILTDLPLLPKCFIIVCEGGEKVSTPEAYRKIDSAPPTQKSDYEGFEAALKGGDIKLICRKLYNRFEDTYPDCERVKHLLVENGALGALMTGSGSVVYGIFHSLEKATAAKEKFANMGLRPYLTTPISAIF